MFRPLSCLSLLLALSTFTVSAAEQNDPFDFLVMGCMPYYMPQDVGRFQNVIAAANKVAPAFSVHCGDTKFGQKPCDDAVYGQIRAAACLCARRQ